MAKWVWSDVLGPLFFCLIGLVVILVVLLQYADTSSEYFRNPSREKNPKSSDSKITTISRQPAPKIATSTDDVFHIFDHVCYINLDKRTDRREEIEDELHRLNVPTSKITRIPGVLATPGSIGCTKAHIAALKYFRAHAALTEGSEWSSCVILEDDFKMSKPNEHVQKALAQFQAKFKTDWDVVLLYGKIDEFELLADCSDIIRALVTSGTVGYVVNRRYINTLLANFEDGLVKLEACRGKEGDNNIDIYWRRLMKSGKWYTFNPMIGQQRESQSDIRNSSNRAISKINNRGLKGVVDEGSTSDDDRGASSPDQETENPKKKPSQHERRHSKHGSKGSSGSKPHRSSRRKENV